jgi:hypothetical protein
MNHSWLFHFVFYRVTVLYCTVRPPRAGADHLRLHHVHGTLCGASQEHCHGARPRCWYPRCYQRYQRYLGGQQAVRCLAQVQPQLSEARGMYEKALPLVLICVPMLNCISICVMFLVVGIYGVRSGRTRHFYAADARADPSCRPPPGWLFTLFMTCYFLLSRLKVQLSFGLSVTTNL